MHGNRNAQPYRAALQWEWNGREAQQMIQPRSLGSMLPDFPADYCVSAIQGKSGKYLAVPDHRFPGRRPIRFFTSGYDASRVLDTVLDIKPGLESEKLTVVEVRLKDALERISADKAPPQADSYVIYTHEEVFEFIHHLKQKAAR